MNYFRFVVSVVVKEYLLNCEYLNEMDLTQVLCSSLCVSEAPVQSINT